MTNQEMNLSDLSKMCDDLKRSLETLSRQIPANTPDRLQSYKTTVEQSVQLAVNITKFTTDYVRQVGQRATDLAKRG